MPFVNKTQPTAVETINKHKSNVNKALEVFSDAYQSVDKTQDALKELIGKLEDERSTIQHALNKAYQEFEYNEAVKVKLGQFRPDKINATDDEATK